MRLIKKIRTIANHIISYPTPINLNYFWNFGSLAGIMLASQIITGLFLTMHYIPHVDHAFDSIEHIMRDVNYGWLLRYMHSNGASVYFGLLYLHIGRGLYYRSFIGEGKIFVWWTGLLIFLLSTLTAFLGYVLPWGQMSLWGATVITNLCSAIPYVGEDIAYWLWGGYCVAGPTLSRFYTLHFVLPFVILGLVGLHLLALHSKGSSNPTGLDNTTDVTTFYPYFFMKDLFGFFCLMGVFMYLVCFEPNALGHPDNYIKANPLVTPTHIVPEWYFLPFYAILRSIPNKLGGVICMVAAILIWGVMPTGRYAYQTSPVYCIISQILFFCLVFSFLMLGWLGSKPVVEPYIGLGQFFSCTYFLYFFGTSAMEWRTLYQAKAKNIKQDKK